jgi:ADP-ribosylglycohydrolase
MNSNIWLSGMMGLVVGDALGIPEQFMTREEIKNRPAGPVTEMESGGVYDMPKGTWSDDSSMALATLAVYLESGILAPEDVMVKFCLWGVKGEFTPFGEAFDEGNTCSEAIYNFLENPDASTCGKTGEYANGNGALMRILPACLYYYEMQKKFPKDMTADVICGIDAISGLTHNHKRSKMACGLYYFMVKEILDAASSNKGQNQSLLDILQSG